MRPVPSLLLLFIVACGGREADIPCWEMGPDACPRDPPIHDAALDVTDAGVSDSNADDASDTALSPDAAAAVAPCLTGGSIFYLSGDPGDPVYPSTITIHEGVTYKPLVNRMSLQLGFHTDSKIYFEVGFTTEYLRSDIGVGVYENATTNYDREERPVLLISADKKFCATNFGRFEIVELMEVPGSSGAELQRLTASFEQRCEGHPETLRGCVHFER